MACLRVWLERGVPRRLVAALLVMVGFAGALSGQGASVLEGVRFWTQSGVTRVVLQTSGEVQYAAGRVPEPERVFIDLVDTQPNHQFTGLAYSIPVNDERVKQIRVALNSRGRTRVVLDLANPAVEYTLSRLTAPDRVVIELRGSETEPARPPAPAVSGGPAPKPFVAPGPAKAPQEPPPVFFVEDNVARLSAAAPGVPPPLPRPVAGDVSRIDPPPAMPAPPARPESGRATAAGRPAAMPVRAPRAIGGAEAMPTPAQRNRAGNRSLARVLGLKLNRIVIDPGHGGQDHGTTGKTGLIEKELVLDVSFRLGQLIKDQLGAEVIYTREDDVFVSLEHRTRLANDKRADLFLSIHANSSRYPAIAGAETYYLSLSAPREDLELAARENSGSERTVGELNEVLRKIALASKIDESREFATRVQSASFELSSQTGGRPAPNRGIKKAPFAVLIGAEMPAVLTEIGFVTNSREEALLKKPEYRQRIAEALFKGVVQYGESLSHFRVARRDSED